MNRNEKTNACDGMRDDGTCGNGSNPENHNKPCMGSKCPHKFKFDGYPSGKKTIESIVPAINYRHLVSEQYRTVCEKTGEFFREVVKFGALLNEVECFIGESRGGVHDSDGLKGWLEDNCPDVNYNTAKGYKAMAAKCAKMIGGGPQALACLQGREEVRNPATDELQDVEAEFVEKRDALFEEVDSRRKLEQMWFEFLGKGGKKVGRPAGSKPFEFKKDPPEVEAARIWNEVVNTLESTTLRDSIDVLEPRIAGIAVGVVSNILKRLNKRALEG